MEKKKQIAKISAFITSVFVIFLSVTYAFINQTIFGTKRQVITSSTLSIELEEENAIAIQNAMPLYDEVGKIQEPFHFRLINNSNYRVNYILHLVDTTDSTKEKLNYQDVKYYLTKDDQELKLEWLSERTDDIIDQGTILANQTIEYSLRLWIDSRVEDSERIDNKTLSLRLMVKAIASEDNAPVVTTTVNGATAKFAMADDYGIVAYGINQSETEEPEYTKIESTLSTEQTWSIEKPGIYYIWVKDNSGNRTTSAFEISSNLLTYPMSSFTNSSASEFSINSGKMNILRQYQGIARITSPILDITELNTLKIVGTYYAYTGFYQSHYRTVYFSIKLLDISNQTVATLLNKSVQSYCPSPAEGCVGDAGEFDINISYDVSKLIGKYKIQIEINNSDNAGNWYGRMDFTTLQYK